MFNKFQKYYFVTTGANVFYIIYTFATMKYNVIFIDLDNTIWDFEANSKNSLCLCYDKFGYERFFPDFNTFYTLYHQHNDLLWGLYREAKITKQELNRERFAFPLESVGVKDVILAENFGKCYLETLSQQSLLIDGAFDLLTYLKTRGYRLFILSNGFEEVQSKKIENAHISNFFEDIILSDHIGYNKPHAKIFEHALQIARVEKAQTVMIGDDWEADIIGAKNSGIDQVFFNRTNKSTSFAPTYEVKELPAIKKFL